MQKSLTLYLPFPPTVNKLYAGKSRRHKSAAYKLWLKTAGWELNRQRLPVEPIGRCNITISAVRPDNRRRDIGNLEKATMDLLVSMRVLQDDSLVNRSTLEWAEGNYECMVIIDALS